MAGVDKEGARGEDVKAAGARETGSERKKKKGEMAGFSGGGRSLLAVVQFRAF